MSNRRMPRSPEDRARAQKASAMLARKVKSLREALGISQAEMGRRLGVTQPKIAKFELCHSPLYTPDLMRYAREFDVPLEYLCDDSVGVDDLEEAVRRVRQPMAETTPDHDPVPTPAANGTAARNGTSHAPAAERRAMSREALLSKMPEVETFEEGMALMMMRMLGTKRVIQMMIVHGAPERSDGSSVTQDPSFADGDHGGRLAQ